MEEYYTFEQASKIIDYINNEYPLKNHLIQYAPDNIPVISGEVVKIFPFPMSYGTLNRFLDNHFTKKQSIDFLLEPYKNQPNEKFLPLLLLDNRECVQLVAFARKRGIYDKLMDIIK